MSKEREMIALLNNKDSKMNEIMPLEQNKKELLENKK